jgi:hypothetical protein
MDRPTVPIPARESGDFTGFERGLTDQPRFAETERQHRPPGRHAGVAKALDRRDPVV